MTDPTDILALDLERALGRRFGASSVTELVQLTGGAMQEIWAFTCDGGQCGEFILRRSRTSSETETAQEHMTIGIECEAHVIEAARSAGTPSPEVLFVLDPQDSMGRGFVMTRVAGEGLGSRILRDPTLAKCRPLLAAECGSILAKLHSTPVSSLPDLPVVRVADRLSLFEDYIRDLGVARPVFMLALRWLRDNAPDAVPAQLVHGDFRLGNLLITAAGIQAVLDWELAHLGDPAFDLAWLCVPSWRFGNIDKPVGGFGERVDLFNAYEQAGGNSNVRSRVHFFEVFGVLQWGVTCARNYELMANERSVERVMIARRSSEAELDLLRLLDGNGVMYAR